jgi:Zn-dependent peptidase ImmA (M78 family)
MIGKRLKLARQGSGLSLRALQNRIGNLVSAQAIGKYERDEMTPNSVALIALSRALGVSEDYLLGGQDELELSGLEFRKKAITSKKEESHVQATVLSWVERYLQIEELIPSARAEWTPPREAPFVVRDMKDAELAAERLRAHWQVGNDAIPKLGEFLEGHGIKVLALDLPENVSGLTCWVKPQNRQRILIIVINAKNSGDRQRFTLLHELGHIILSIASNLDEEKAANRFASAFSMPAPVLWLELGKHRNKLTIPELVYLKRSLGVSMQAITYRCKDLEIIDSTTYQAMFTDFSKRGWRKHPYEPYPLPKEEPKRFERLCYRGLSEGAISEAKTAELLGISVRDLQIRMEEYSENSEMAKT